MVLRHYYDGTLLEQAVQLAEEHGFSARAVLGEADTVAVVVEDPAGTLDFVGDRRWIMIEDACPVGAQTVWRGYTGKQSISEGGGTSTIYPDGVGRRWNLDLIEDNTRLGFRLVTGTDGKRPAETVSHRLTWLLASPYLSGLVADHGLVASSTVAMDQHDYRGQSAADVLGDLAVACGYNFYARYREASDDVELAFYDADTSALDVSTLRLSNDPADIDYITTWPTGTTVAVERDPSRYARGIYLPYAKGAVYVGGGPGLRDMTAPTATVKTAAKATTLANRLLAQHAEQDEKLVGVRVQLPAANLNDVRHGQRIAIRQTHLPGWTAFRGARVVSKSFGRPENLTQAFYDVDLELSRCDAPALVQYVAGYTGNMQLTALASAPTPGNMLILWMGGRGDIDPRMVGFTVVANVTASVPTERRHGTMCYRVVQAGDSAAWTEVDTGSSGFAYLLMEVSGLGTAPDVSISASRQTPITSLTTGAMTPTAGGSGIVVGGFVTHPGHSDQPPISTATPGAGYTELLDLMMAGGSYSPHVWAGYQIIGQVQGSYTVTAAYSGNVGINTPEFGAVGVIFKRAT